MELTGRERLKQYCERAHLKQYELADLLGITESYLSQLLSGRRAPGRTNALKIEEVTGVPVRSWSDSSVGKSDGKRVEMDDKAKVSSRIRSAGAS